MSRMMIWNSETEQELTVDCESHLWSLIRFAFGWDVCLGKEYPSHGCPRRDIQQNMQGPPVGHVTWIDQDMEDSQ